MDVAIVGGGIVGTAIAARLSGTDHRVTLVERSSLGGETTAASAAAFIWNSPNPDRFLYDLRERAWETYGALVDEGAISATQTGVLYVAESDEYASAFEPSAAILREYDVEASVVPPDDLEAYGIAPGRFRGGLHTADDPYFDPAELVDHFASEAAADGVDVRTGVEVRDVILDGGAVAGLEVADVGDGSGEDDPSIGETTAIEADVVVNAAGPWAPRINDFAGVSLPLCHTVGPMLVVEGESGSASDLPFVIFESRRYARPAGDSRIYFGEFLTEFAPDHLFDPPRPDELAIPEAFRAATADLGDALPAFADAPIVDEWVGLRTVTPDGRPIVGETAIPRFHVACGMSGLGITLAPAVADVLAETLAGTVDEGVRRGLSPDRF